VLVILGLLVGGILAGQSLIRAAELRSVTTDFQKYQSASLMFRDKYFSLPGDMTNATAFWNSFAGSCTTAGGVGSQTCNGDGNGQINNENHGPSHETFRAWQHLSNAGLIEGNMTGYYPTAPCSSAVCWVAALNAPPSKLNNAIWTLRYIEASDLWSGKNASRNVISLGTAGTTGRWHEPILSAPEVYSIEKKVDDGMPFTGQLVLMSQGYSSSCWNWNGVDKDPGATYKLNSTDVACVLLFDAGF
jgi:hypothetical protein